MNSAIVPPYADLSKVLAAIFCKVVTRVVARVTSDELYWWFWKGLGVTQGVLALSSSWLVGIVVVMVVGPWVPPKAAILFKLTHTFSVIILPTTLMSLEK